MQAAKEAGKRWVMQAFVHAQSTDFYAVCHDFLPVVGLVWFVELALECETGFVITDLTVRRSRENPNRQLAVVVRSIENCDFVESPSFAGCQQVRTSHFDNELSVWVDCGFAATHSLTPESQNISSTSRSHSAQICQAHCNESVMVPPENSRNQPTS